MSEGLPDHLASQLHGILGSRLSTSQDLRRQHGVGESYHPPAPPDAVAYPATTEEVAEIVKICARDRVPVIPFGAGTSLEGNVSALQGGVCIDLAGMNRILSVNVGDLDATVEAGVTRLQLEARLREEGLFFAVDPGADAALGGMASTPASGTLTVRYGGMRENVLSLTVVLADGRVIRTASRARKSAAGYDLTRLFIGAEGTLGVITELVLRLFGLPEAISSAACTFPTIDDAVSCGIQIIQLGIPVARMEFLDEVQIEAVNQYSNLACAIAPTLFLEFHGSDTGVAEQAQAAAAIAAEHRGADFQWAAKTEDRNRIWRARHDAYNAARALRRGANGYVTDVCVPLSQLAACISQTRKDIDTSGLTVPILGHIGDGNFHLFILIDPNDPNEIAAANRINEGLVNRALKAGGTCTGEHGIGYGKIDALEKEQGDAVQVMKMIKTALDPQSIMNPGKIFRSDTLTPQPGPATH